MRVSRIHKDGPIQTLNHPNTPFLRKHSVCQIFYELKGGKVSYGKGHAARFGHEAEGEGEFSGLFPEVSKTDRSINRLTCACGLDVCMYVCVYVCVPTHP